MAELSTPSLFDPEPPREPRPRTEKPQERTALSGREEAPAPTAARPSAVLAAEVRAAYVEQIMRDQQTLRMGIALECPDANFYRERIRQYSEDLTLKRGMSTPAKEDSRLVV